MDSLITNDGLEPELVGPNLLPPLLRRELIIENKTVPEQLLKLLDEKYFSKLKEAESKLTKAEKKFETVITKSK